MLRGCAFFLLRLLADVPMRRAGGKHAEGEHDRGSEKSAAVLVVKIEDAEWTSPKITVYLMVRHHCKLKASRRLCVRHFRRDLRLGNLAPPGRSQGRVNSATTLAGTRARLRPRFGTHPSGEGSPLGPMRAARKRVGLWSAGWGPGCCNPGPSEPCGAARASWSPGTAPPRRRRAASCGPRRCVRRPPPARPTPSSQSRSGSHPAWVE
jgi:hypothetical protein